MGLWTLSGGADFGHHAFMDRNRSNRAWTLAGIALLVLTLGVMAGRPVKADKIAADDMRDAVAAPISSPALGGARVIRPDAGYFASPAGRRAEAEKILISSRRATKRRASQRLAR
jgi:hypothetical protein